jgi:hypothetical protein
MSGVSSIGVEVPKRLIVWDCWIHPLASIENRKFDLYDICSDADKTANNGLSDLIVNNRFIVILTVQLSY